MQLKCLMNMTLNLLFFFLIISVTGSAVDYYEDEGSNTPVKFLVTSSSGLQFQKSINDDESVDIIYDCSVGVAKKGLVKMNDNLHPPNMKSLIIQNCSNITVDFSDPEGFTHDYENNDNIKMLREVKIKNTHIVTLSTDSIENYNYHNYRSHNYIRPKDMIIDISRIELLKIKAYAFKEKIGHNLTWTLKIQDIILTEIESKAVSPIFINVSLKEVRKVVIKENSISLLNSAAVLTVKNSSFETVERNGIVFEGSHVELCNNVFKNLDRIVVKANKSFLFAKNYVKNMEHSFNIRSPNVQIVSNTFETIKIPFFPDIVYTNSYGVFSVLNISNNIMDILPQGFFLMPPESHPDVIHFKNNKFNCSCKYRYFVNEGYVQKNAEKIFLYQNDGNVCINLDNCPLHKVLNHLSEVCRQEFICKNEERTEDLLDTYLASISSTLKVISENINALVARNISASSNNLPPTQPNTTVNF